jgi:murein DD-endopeptidase MepM/ murein hydrolase activator NlpD
MTVLRPLSVQCAAMMLMATAFGLTAGAPEVRAGALEIRLAPDDHVYIAHEQRVFGIANVAVQNAAIVNTTAEPLKIEEVNFEVRSGSELVGSLRYAGDRFDGDWATLMKYYLSLPGIQEEEEPRYRFRDLMGKNITLSPTTTLAPQTAMYVSRQFLMIHATLSFVDGRPKYTWPDRLHITVQAKTAAGKLLRAANELRIVNYQPKNEYHFPVKGRWYINSSSSVRSHHRYLPTHEFALDLIQIGAGGSSYKGDGTKYSDYYAYGKDVHAVADGVVVTANDDVAQTRLRRKGESPEDFARAVMDPLAKKGYLASGGNLVVIEHAGGEYSSYAHLRHGSIRVKKGDTVKRDQVIAQIGLSGDGYQPHIHFQITDSPDMSYSRGIPLIFTNVKPVLFTSSYDTDGRRQIQTGEFVDTVDQ